MARKDIIRGLAYEKRKAKEHGGKHVGGPGKPDYVRGKTKVEVKDRITKVTKPELQKYIRQGRTVVRSKSGFTKPAIEYRNRYHKNVKLFQRGKEVK